MSDFVVEVSRGRTRPDGAGLAWATLSFVCLCAVIGCVDTLRESYGYLHLHHGPHERAAHLAALSSGWVMLSIFLLLFLGCFARTLRATLGLPRPTPRGGTLARIALRMAQILVVAIAIGRNLRHELLLLSDPHALRDTFAWGALVCILLGISAPRLIATGRAALAAARPMRGLALIPLDRLPTQGRVRVRGRLRRVGDDPEPAFELVGPGGFARLDVDRERLVMRLLAHETELPTDTPVEVIGAVGGETGYRGVPQISAGDDRLYVYPVRGWLRARLLVAASIELFTGTAIVASAVAFVAGAVFFALA